MHKINDWKNLRILVVEDVDSIRKSIVDILMTFNFEKIIQSNSGNDAWLILRIAFETDQGIDIILSDINMSNGSGLALLKKVRSNANTYNLPFILISTEKEKSIIIKAIELGVSSYIIKPITHENLRSKLVDVLYS